MAITKEELITSFISQILPSAIGIKFDSVEAERIRSIAELARAAYTETASVPERLFVVELIEYLVRVQPDLALGCFSEEELDEIYEGSSQEVLDERDATLEMFINPRGLFFNGRIRPDVVFRKGKGNYIVFEIDSFQFHSSQEQLMKDKVRERKIQSLGYPVYRYAAKEILTPAGAYSCAIEAIETLTRHGFVEKKV